MKTFPNLEKDPSHEIRVYNTLTRRKERFEPREQGKVAMYFCGPTVYAETHLGHLRPALTGDLIARFFRYLDYDVQYIVNFTDVDDKLIRRAQETGSTVSELAQRYSAEYLQVMEALRIDQVSQYVRVTDHIEDIIAMIESLVANGKAYAVGGDVYYDVRTKEDYGKLSGRSIEELLAGARVAVDERKHHPADFALWKASKPGEISWPSPWGEGRPGWHIECSALGLKYLGDGFDIHGGGDDLIFPHHENEVAQSEAFTGSEPFVRYWVHNGMIQIDEEKMSKSLGNFVTAADLLDSASASAVRLYLFGTHYRNPLAYSFEGLAETERAFSRLARGYADWQELCQTPGTTSATTSEAVSLDEERLLRASERSLQDFVWALADDFNSARAIAAMFDFFRTVNGMVHGAGFDPERSRAGLQTALETLGTMFGLLGLDPEDGAGSKGRGGTSDDEATSEAALLDLLLALRQEARAAKNWQLADRIRSGLDQIGFAIEDTPQGSRWRRILR